ncbi:MAG: transcriptional regulator [Bacteroidales bacterium]|nr:transcriptional regulator [Bacteroidales bacterium]
MMEQLDPVLHSQLRLAIISLLVKHEKLDFSYLKKQTESSSGNLSVQIKKLEDAGYIEVKKRFKNNYPQTSCLLTEKGLSAFEQYVASINAYLNPED